MIRAVPQASKLHPQGRCAVDTRGQRESSNIEDRRGESGGGGGGGFGRMPIVLGGGGIGSILLLLLVLFLSGGNLGNLGPGQGPGPGPDDGQQAGQFSPREEEQKHFVSVVLAQTEDVWKVLFEKMGKKYREPKL